MERKRPTQDEIRRHIGRLPNLDAPQLIRPRVSHALFQGLRAGNFGYGYFPEETLGDEDGLKAQTRAEWYDLMKERVTPLCRISPNNISYHDGLRVGRVLMDLQARETVGEVIITPEDIRAYRIGIKSGYRACRNKLRYDQEWFRNSFSGRLGLKSLQSELERVAREYEKYRWPGDRWQIRMGLYDAFFIYLPKIVNTADALRASS